MKHGVCMYFYSTVKSHDGHYRQGVECTCVDWHHVVLEILCLLHCLNNKRATLYLTITLTFLG